MQCRLEFGYLLFRGNVRQIVLGGLPGFIAPVNELSRDKKGTIVLKVPTCERMVSFPSRKYFVEKQAVKSIH